MKYEEMVKLAYEDILDSLVDEEDFEKEARTAFDRLYDRTTYQNEHGRLTNLPNGTAQNWVAVNATRPYKYHPGDQRFNEGYFDHLNAAGAHNKTLTDYKAGKASIEDLKRTGAALKSAKKEMLDAGRKYKAIYPNRPLEIEEKMRKVDPNFSSGKTGKTLADIKAGAMAKLQAKKGM